MVYPTSRGPGGARALPAQPNLEHLKNEAKQRLRSLREADATAKLADAQFQLAREYGFASWRQLKAEVDRHANGTPGSSSVFVFLWYDDVTPKDFILEILEEVFQKKKGEPRGFQIMLGTGQSRVLGGVYPRDEADRLVDRVAELAAKKNFPLRCTMEPAPDVPIIDQATTVARYAGTALSSSDLSFKDISPSLRALCDIAMIADDKHNANCFGHSIGMNQQHWPDIAVTLSHHFLKPGCSPPDGGGKTCAEVFKDIGIASGSTFSLLKLITWMAKRPSSDARSSVGMRESGPRMWRTSPLDGGPWEVTTTGSVTALVDRNGEAAIVSQDVYLLASDRLVLDKILRVVETIALNGYDTLSFTDGDVIVHTIAAQDAGAIIRFLHEES
jgi:ATP-dependent Clp protease adapter protein ClpS